MKRKILGANPLWKWRPCLSQTPGEEHHWHADSQEGGLPSPLLLLGPNFWHHPSSCCWLLNRLSRHFKFGNQCNKLLLLKITQITWFGLPLSLFPLDSFCRNRRGKCKCPHRPGPLPSSVLYKPPYSQEPKCCLFLEQLILPKILNTNA